MKFKILKRSPISGMRQRHIQKHAKGICKLCQKKAIITRTGTRGMHCAFHTEYEAIRKDNIVRVKEGLEPLPNPTLKELVHAKNKHGKPICGAQRFGKLKFTEDWNEITCKECLAGFCVKTKFRIRRRHMGSIM